MQTEQLRRRGSKIPTGEMNNCHFQISSDFGHEKSMCGRGKAGAGLQMGFLQPPYTREIRDIDRARKWGDVSEVD